MGKINLNTVATKIEVDNRIPLRYYYRIADNLLKQATVYRQENNLVDLYIMLLRFSSLVSETIPYHQSYLLLPKERTLYKKKLLNVLDELESIKPEVNKRVKELNEVDSGPWLLQLDGPETTSYHHQTSLSRPLGDTKRPSDFNVKQPTSTATQSSWKYSDEYPIQMDKQFQKLAIKLPNPNKETLSRHSFLGPNGLRSQWRGPIAESKVNYPSSADLTLTEISADSGQYDVLEVKDNRKSGGIEYAMESVLSLDDGRWIQPAEPDDSLPLSINGERKDPFQLGNIYQPCPPPVLAQIQNHDPSPIHHTKVADPRPGLAKSLQNGIENSNSYQHLHVPVRLMDDFLRLARANTERNLETCAILAGSLKNRVFHITTLIIPKQESTSDSCQTLNEEEIFEVQDNLSLFPLGWIHTHPTQTCFMSSVDLHTHYSYQIMLPEAIAIVMAPTDSESPHGIFHLSDPGGVSVIRNCQERGFHPHEEPTDGTSIYEHCSHVLMNPYMKFDVIDLR